ncbi:MAG TPA: hypothetical protein VN033_06585 [Vulgatibacter sp.]|nr:hypothetical protein [Vulgatibacter sp.]
MGKDNQDYFKRAGRPIGPAGPLRQFKAALSQERAILRRGEEHKIPSERPPVGDRPAGWLHPPEGQERASGEAASQGQEKGETRASQGPGGSPGGGSPSDGGSGRPPGGEPAATQAPGTAGSGGPTAERAGPKPAHPEAASGSEGPSAEARRSRTSGDAEATPPTPGGGGLAELEAGNQEPLHTLEPREYEAPYGFGIPASEEAALGGERAPHERLGRETDQRPTSRSTLGERMAKRYPRPFRLLGKGAAWLDRPIRRALDRMHSLGEIAKRA